MLLIRHGVDPERTWRDELIAVPVLVLVLLYFQNGLLAILSYLVVDLIPETLRRLRPGSGSGRVGVPASAGSSEDTA